MWRIQEAIDGVFITGIVVILFFFTRIWRSNVRIAKNTAMIATMLINRHSERPDEYQALFTRDDLFDED
jgi:hypothetical protein